MSSKNNIKTPVLNLFYKFESLNIHAAYKLKVGVLMYKFSFTMWRCTKPFDDFFFLQNGLTFLTTTYTLWHYSDYNQTRNKKVFYRSSSSNNRTNLVEFSKWSSHKRQFNLTISGKAFKNSLIAIYSMLAWWYVMLINLCDGILFIYVPFTL